VQPHGACVQETAAADRAPRRNFGLDVLRCAAILIVLANHAFLGFFVLLGGITWEGRRAAWSLTAFVSIEWLFVLSGFLIGTMMIRSFEAEGTFWSRARSFWLRRWFRTLPNYYLFLLMNIAIVTWGLHGTLPTGKPLWQHAVFAQNLLGPERVPFFFNEAWSLALDEWFYLTLPLLVGLMSLVARARPRQAFLGATALLILVPTTLRLLVPIPTDPFAWDLNVRRITLLHLDATGWGVLAALVNRWAPDAWRRAAGAKAVVGLFLMLLGIAALQAMFQVLPGPAGDWLVAWLRFPVAFALTCTGLGTFLALPAIARLRAPAPAAASAVATLSNYTYSIYLSHFPLFFLIAEVTSRTMGEPPFRPGILWMLVALWLALVVTVSALTYTWFEKPTSDLRERFTRKVDASPFGPAPPP
jgi:peptidoglycan/LPS O-acetylase OafA/YrhL